MQVTYCITAIIDDEEYTLARQVPDEELEGELQHLCRRQEFKNINRFEIKEEELHESFYLRT